MTKFMSRLGSMRHRRHGRDEDMVRRSQFGHGNRLSFEIANRFHAVGPEQLKTSHVYAAKQHNRHAGVHLDDVWRNESHADVYRTRSEALVHVHGELNVLDAVESLAPQQVFGHILRRDADAGNLAKTNGRGFRRGLLGRYPRAPKDAGGRGGRERGE